MSRASLTVILAFALIAAVAPSSFDPGAQAKVDAIAAAAIAGGIPGVTIGIDDPKLGQMVKSYGKADASGTPLTAGMHYRIGSVTKTFTAFAVLHLVDTGRVSLGDPVSTYVANFPHGRAITIRDLLAMRGGLYDFVNDASFERRYEADPALPDWTPVNTLALIERHASAFTPPGARTVYNNSEYILLGFVIEKATGESAESYIDSLLGGLGLQQTWFPLDATIPSPHAHGYVENLPSSLLRDVTLSNPKVPWTSGGMISTVPDMLKYAKELGTGAGLTPATFALRMRWNALRRGGVRSDYGLGIGRLGDWIGHNGSMLGYTTDVFYLPSAGASVVVMVNQGGKTDPAYGVWREIVQTLYPDSLVENF